MCGNPGTISFSSPEYEAYENPSAWAGEGMAATYGAVTTNGTVRITVVRTGGGYGTVGARYRLRHGTTDAADVTPHAHYTTRCARSFHECSVDMIPKDTVCFPARYVCFKAWVPVPAR